MILHRVNKSNIVYQESLQRFRMLFVTFTGYRVLFFCFNFHAVDVKNRKGKRATVRAIIVARGRFKKEMSDSALECWLNFDVILF